MNNCLQIQHPHEDLKLLMDVSGWLPGPCAGKVGSDLIGEVI
jgi:hypothetical protein